MVARRGAEGDEVGVAVDLDEGGADVANPAESFEGDEARVADHDDALEFACGAVETARTALVTYAVFDYEVTSLDP